MAQGGLAATTTASIKKRMSRGTSFVASRFGDESDLPGGKCHRTTKWHGSLVGRLLAW